MALAYMPMLGIRARIVTQDVTPSVQRQIPPDRQSVRSGFHLALPVSLLRHCLAPLYWTAPPSMVLRASCKA